ncbi:hypothetical protein BX600DRAFT_274370 [Xylariales sp. PMI_506]|nr:hypothetical protein BX600DRAFT_274370 [Xylariales sp. PMI_506]
MNSGVQLACAMWVMAAFCIALVVLRLYTRIYIVKFVGAEDHLYAWTGVLFVSFTVFIQVAVNNGLGQNFWQLSISESSDAIFWTYVANTFAITGNAMAKLSMGFFLLRVVQVKWHKLALWAAVVVTSATSTALTIMLWNQTTPIRASWDPLRTPGKWNIQIQPMSVGLGVWSSVCDFFFAIFPWLFIWSLRMTKKEKVTLALGMSLGVIAGACGIVRTVVLDRLDVYNYTLNFVPYFAWAGAEIAVGMVCTGIPTLRPLYLKTRGIRTSYGRHGQSQVAESPRFTMCEPKFTTRPATAPAKISMHSRTDSGPVKPASVYTRVSSRGSVEDVSDAERGDIGVIWVKNEIQVQRDHVSWPLPDGFI